MELQYENKRRWLKMGGGSAPSRSEASSIRHPSTPVEFWQKAYAKVRRVRSHQGGSNRAAVIWHTRYLEHKDAHGHEDRLVGTIGSLDIVKEWDDVTEHYRVIIAPERGDVLDMELLAEKVCNAVSERFGSFKYAGAIHEKRQSNGRLNKHIHLIIKDTFGLGANAFKKEFSTQAAREATVQFEDRGLHYLPNILDKTLILETGKLEHELIKGDHIHGH